METSTPRFEFELTPADIESVRRGLRELGAANADMYDGSRLRLHLESWATFVDTDWTRWDVAEYANDIQCRYWLEAVLEYSISSVHVTLESYVYAIDGLFRTKARPCRYQRMNYAAPRAKTESPLFWESTSIHPDMT